MWVDSSSGRQFSRIASVDDGADTVTVDTAYTQTEGSRNWGIGGKRNDFDNTNSRKLFEADVENSWIIETETDQAISSAINVEGGASGDRSESVYVQGSSGSRKTITQSANEACFELNTGNTKVNVFRRLKLENTNGTKTGAYGIEKSDAAQNTGGALQVVDCEIGDSTNQLLTGIYQNASTDRWGSLLVLDCYIHDCTAAGVQLNSSLGYDHRFIGNFVRGNGGAGMELTTGGHAGAHIIIGNIFADNTGHGLEGTLNVGANNDVVRLNQIIGNVFYSNGSDGFAVVGATVDTQLIHTNNIYMDNGGYGMGGTDTNISPQTVVQNRSNCYYNNTSGTVEETDIGNGDDAITSDPLFEDPSNGDFRLKSTSPCKAAGWPSDIGGASLTTSYVDVGAAQRQEPVGGSTIIYTSSSLLKR
jgi:hypothetical protein